MTSIKRTSHGNGGSVLKLICLAYAFNYPGALLENTSMFVILVVWNSTDELGSMLIIAFITAHRSQEVPY